MTTSRAALAYDNLSEIIAAASQAEDALDKACGQLTVGQCPGCGHAVIFSGGPAGPIYDTGGAPYTCPDTRPAG